MAGDREAAEALGSERKDGAGEKCDTPEQDYGCPYLGHITSPKLQP
jgi:hypothetical protein